MPTLVYKEGYFDCATAIKGDDYIRLLDSNGCLVASFEGITDFTAFTLQNGNYTSPTADHECRVAVIRDDGTIGKGGHKCSDIVPKSRLVTALISKTWEGSTVPYIQTIEIAGVEENSVVEIALPPTATAAQVAAFQRLALQDGGQSAGSITLRAFGTKNSSNIPVNVVIRGDL